MRVYELIVDPKLALKDKKVLALFSFVVVILSFFVYSALRDSLGIFSTPATLYFIITLILSQVTTKIFEEIEYEEETGKLNYLDIALVYLAITFGMFVAFLLLPVRVEIFGEGSLSNPLYILKNNLTLAFTFFILSFIFGTGAEFLLAYNSNVLASVFLQKPHILLLAFLEFIAFFYFALAGGVLSISVIRDKLHKKVIVDIVKMLILGTSLLILAYFLEITIFLKF